MKTKDILDLAYSTDRSNVKDLNMYFICQDKDMKYQVVDIKWERSIILVLYNADVNEKYDFEIDDSVEEYQYITTLYLERNRKIGLI